MIKKISILTLILISSFDLFSQGYFSGDLELRNDYYVRDTAIGASGTPQYDYLKSSMDSWLTSNYRNEKWGLDVGMRLDFFINSNLHAPGSAFTKVKLGRIYVTKDIGKLSITGGHFYDQFGSGIAFRAYEDRFLGIDNSIFGVRAKYELTKNINLKAFGGLRNDRLSETVIGTSSAFIKGLNAEGNFKIGEDLNLTPGISIVNRTIAKSEMEKIVNQVNGYANFGDRFLPVHNVYVFTANNTLSYKRFSWFIEGGYKTKEAIQNLAGNLIDKAGNIVYTNLTYSTKGFGITGQFKRTENFQFRDSPLTTSSILRGSYNFIAPINKQHSSRLAARYSPASQEIGEVAFSFDVTKKLSKKLGLQITASEIHGLDVSFKHWAKTLLFRELTAELDWKAGKKLKGDVGLQFVQYHSEFYEQHKGDANTVFAFTPFAEISYKFDKKNALRIEAQYQFTPNDFGQWAFFLAEYSMAPNFTISVADQWNIVKGPNDASRNNVHYPSVFTSYTLKTTRIFASYVRQVEGIVCTGGVCRLEPAFSGVKVGVNTSF